MASEDCGETTGRVHMRRRKERFAALSRAGNRAQGRGAGRRSLPESALPQGWRREVNEKNIFFRGPSRETFRGESSLRANLEKDGFGMDSPSSSEADSDDEMDAVDFHLSSQSRSSESNESSGSETSSRCSSTDDESEKSAPGPLNDESFGYYIGTQQSVCDLIEEVNKTSRCASADCLGK